MSAVPTPLPQPSPSIREVVREALAQNKQPDPHAIVDGVLQALSPDQYQEAARAGVAMIAVEESRFHRTRMMHGPPPKSPKWAATARTAKANRVLFEVTVYVPTENDGKKPMFLGDCSAEDLAGVSALLRLEAGGMLGNADRYDLLAKKLKKGAVVRSLPYSTVERIFHA